jgi:hypothetical protein
MNLTTVLLIATTLPHFLVPIAAPTPLYAGVTFLSSCLSVAWHASESNASSALGIADHIVAAVWGGLDIYMFYGTDIFGPMLALNGGVIGLNWMAGQAAVHGLAPYWLGHSAWHLVSAAKSVYLVRQL